MNVLALETATSSVGAALARDGDAVSSETVTSRREHAELLHPLVAEVLRREGLSLSEVGAVAVDVGPGLFTGIRVGVAAAKGFALALSVPAVAVTSLEAIEAAVRAKSKDLDGALVVPVVDLRRGDVAWSLPNGSGRRSLSWGPPETLVAEIARVARPGAAVLLAGEGALRYSGALTGGAGRSWRLANEDMAAPSVASVAMLAVAALERGDVVTPSELVPCYLREADVRINWSTRHDETAGEGG